MLPLKKPKTQNLKTRITDEKIKNNKRTEENTTERQRVERKGRWDSHEMQEKKKKRNPEEPT